MYVAILIYTLFRSKIGEKVRVGAAGWNGGLATGASRTDVLLGLVKARSMRRDSTP